jgi:cytochrome c553
MSAARAIFFWLALGAMGPLCAAEPEAEALELFEKKVRPVLAGRCYECHGEKKQKAGLRADSRAALLKGGDNGPSIVPGAPEKSRLLRAVSYADVDLQMPPKAKLAPAEIAALTEWIRRGAPWPGEKAAGTGKSDLFDLPKRRAEHWCWQPLKLVPPPKVKDTTWPRTDLDRFILARLEAHSLKPAPPADRPALLRRASFALTGLPPTPEEVEAFVRDTSASAFAKTVDRLLASPHFGERWARHWMDLVRYAETRGHEFEPIIPNAWQYRDYLVRAFNADVPYDRFTTEHLAGDLLPAPRLNPATGGNESILGTGFWFLGEEVHSPVDIRQDEADRLDNRLDVMTKTFLGLTVACARCHDHKFDAISARDYYALSGFLVSAGYRQAPFEQMEQHRRVAEQLEAHRRTAGPALLKSLGAALEESLRHPPLLLASEGPWALEMKAARANTRHLLHPVAVLAADSESFAVRRREMLEPQPKTASPVVAQMVADYATARPEQWFSDGFSFGLGPLRAGEPLFDTNITQPLRGLLTRGAAVLDPAWHKLKASAGSERDGSALGKWDRPGRTLRTPKVELKTSALWYLARGAGRAYAVVDSHLIVQGPLHGKLLFEWNGKPDEWQWVRHDLAGYTGHRVHVEFTPREGELAIAQVVEFSNDSKPVPPLNPIVLEAIRGAADMAALVPALHAQFKRAALALRDGSLAGGPSSAAVAELADFLARRRELLLSPEQERQFLAVTATLAQQRAELAAQIKPESAVAPAMFEGNGVDEPLLIRGATKNPGDRVPRRLLEAMGGAAAMDFGSGSGRLELARQVVDPANPLTARVIVNRVWLHLFGSGLVPTPDNFGVLGEKPSHPELLDYLADRFAREHGWSIKKLMREILLSRVWQMESRPADPQAEQRDPQNRLLHRANVRRLEGEAIRDALLAVSGRLDRKAGGPPVPVHLTPFMDGRGKPASGPLDGDGRRSLYLSVRRNFLSPMMLAFDTPIPFTTVGRRNVSNVPAQALILMNDPFVMQQARFWAKRLVHNHNESAPEPLLDRAYREAFGRSPTAAEKAQAAAFLRQHPATQEKGAPLDLLDERAWTDLCHVLFNVKEFIYLN